MNASRPIKFCFASCDADYELGQEIIKEYAQSLNGLVRADEDLKKEYAPPDGALLFAESDGQFVGCCALRPLLDSNYDNACEMRRLYVKPTFRNEGIGRILAQLIIERATSKGYSHLLLDTLDEMESARALYEDLGFTETDPYYHSEHLGSTYFVFELDISKPMRY